MQRLIVRFAFIATLCLVCVDVSAQTALATNSWHSVATGRNLALSVLPPQAPGTHRLPVVIYLQNLAAPRVGTDSDEAIISDFLKEGFLVVTLDYAKDAKARVPFINRDFAELRSQIHRKQFLQNYPFDPTKIFIVPGGCRLLRDVVYYREPDRNLAMDIIYPANPAQPVGAVLEFSCDNQDRMGNFSLDFCSDTILAGEATEGLAAVMADHPVAAPYKGLDAMPDCAWKLKAAVRTLRAEGAKLGLNGKIAPIGFSRGSGMALMLVTTAGLKEFEGQGENTNANSDVQGAVVMSGRFTYLDLLPDDKMIPRYEKVWGARTNSLAVWRSHGALDYLTNAATPLFLTINITESPDALHQMKVLRQRLAALGSDEIFMMDRDPRGHRVTLVPEILTAMDAYLKARLN